MPETWVRSFPRIHVGLLDMAGVTPRRYGGVGFFLEGPPTVVRARRSDSVTVRTEEELDKRTARAIRRGLAGLLRARNTACEVEIVQRPPVHVGLGSSTSLILAVLRAAATSLEIDVAPPELQALSKRGAASGIGVNGFFSGGWLWDGGHRVTGSATFLPSAYGASTEIPPVLASAPMPANWRVVTVLPQGENDRRFSRT